MRQQTDRIILRQIDMFSFTGKRPDAETSDVTETAALNPPRLSFMSTTCGQTSPATPEQLLRHIFTHQQTRVHTAAHTGISLLIYYTARANLVIKRSKKSFVVVMNPLINQLSNNN